MPEIVGGSYYPKRALSIPEIWISDFFLINRFKGVKVLINNFLLIIICLAAENSLNLYIITMGRLGSVFSLWLEFWRTRLQLWTTEPEIIFTIHKLDKIPGEDGLWAEIFKCCLNLRIKLVEIFIRVGKGTNRNKHVIRLFPRKMIGQLSKKIGVSGKVFTSFLLNRLNAQQLSRIWTKASWCYQIFKLRILEHVSSTNNLPLHFSSILPLLCWFD